MKSSAVHHPFTKGPIRSVIAVNVCSVVLVAEPGLKHYLDCCHSDLVKEVCKHNYSNVCI